MLDNTGLMEQSLSTVSPVWVHGTHDSATLSSWGMDNVTTNSTSKPKEMYAFHKREQVGFLIFVLVAIILGNLAVLIAIGVSKRGTKSRMTFFIMHLAIADLSVGLLSVLPDLVWKVTVEWYAGDAMCKIVKFLQALALYGSTYILVSLSIDRLDAIARPLGFSNSRFRARVLVSVAWGLSCLFSIPMLILSMEITRNGSRQCTIMLHGRPQWQIYLILLATALFFIPALIIAICYYAMLHVIWSKAAALSASSPGKSGRLSLMKNTSKKFKRLKGGSREESEQLDKKHTMACSTSSRGVIPQAKIRTVKMTFVIVIVFIVCWCPFFIFNLLDVYEKIPKTPQARATSILLQSFAPLNSLANPLIYGMFSSRICRNLRNIRWVNLLLSRICCCCPHVWRRDRSSSLYSSTGQTMSSDFGRKLSVSRTYCNGVARLNAANYNSRNKTQPEALMLKELR